jgi:hypothetical protein
MKKNLWLFIIPWLFISNGITQDSLLVGNKYLNFEINSTPFISGAYFLRDMLALEAGVGFSFNGENDSNGLGIRLGLDKYLQARRLSPFAGGYVKFEINPNALEQAGWKGSRLSLEGHWGLNLFLFQNFSAAGTLGAELIFNSPKEGDDSTTLASMTSSIKFRFFF